MGAGREDAPSLTSQGTGGKTAVADTRQWPIVVRRARPADREQVLAFTTNTWNGHDYIPSAWESWLEARDGAFLVAMVGPPGGKDADDRELDIGAPIAITRVAMVAPGEAWLEGIRVHPNVRGMGVASDLQVAELNWIAAQDAHVVRYATSWRNEASHRLGARDGIETVARLRSWWWSATGTADVDDDEPSGFDPAVRAAATALRRTALDHARAAGLVVAAGNDAAALWDHLDRDATFAAGQRLYEARAWAFGELTRDLFVRHVERGEVLRAHGQDGWAVAILVSEQLPSEDSALRFALLVGDGRGAATLADHVRRSVGEPVRFRVPVDAPMIRGHEHQFAAAGFVSPADWEMHLLARRMDAGKPIPAVNPQRLILEDAPQPISAPRW